MAWPVDEVVTVEYPGFNRTTSVSLVSPYQQLREEAASLRMFRARAAYVLRPDGWWAAWLASLVAPEVVTANDPRSRRFSTTCVDVDGQHTSVRAFRIAAGGQVAPEPTALNGPLHLEASLAAEAEALQLLRMRGVEAKYVVIHPGSGASVKEWPVQRWRHVADALDVAGYRTVVTGSHAERAITEQITGEGRDFVNLAGETTLGVLTEILRNAALVLGPDCGPLHLAVAAGTPSVHLFGPSDPLRYGPWGSPDRHRVVRAGWSCPRCGDLSAGREAGCGCMLAIKPDEVIAAARTLLGEYAR
jgi:heptosyltransferase-2/heptosyltransferase-3